MIDQVDSLEVEIPDFNEITPNGDRMLLEKVVKHNGVWKIHKIDPDDIFPSDPHADRVDGPEKLNLYTGDVYSKTNRTHLYKLPKCLSEKWHPAQINSLKNKQIN